MGEPHESLAPHPAPVARHPRHQAAAVTRVHLGERLHTACGARGRHTNYVPDVTCPACRRILWRWIQALNAHSDGSTA
jgi:hypothetical protein